MSQTAQRRMTVEEFFEWQSRQDRNYELVDGVPVLFRGTSKRSMETEQRILENLRSILDADVEVELELDMSSLVFSAADTRMTVVPSDAGFDFARMVTRTIFDSDTTLVLIDPERPRASVWRGSGKQRRSAEATTVSDVIDVPEIGVRVALSAVYAGIEFDGVPAT